MKIKVIGKAHKEGISKKGNPYNFNEFHYIGRRYGVEGEAGLTATLDPFLYPLASIQVGATYEVEFDNTGRVLAFDLAK